MTSSKRLIGDVGEELSCRFLKEKGFEILRRNYLKKWGEIDVVAVKDETLHFVEVKTQKVNRFPRADDDYRVEENVTEGKLKRIQRTVGSYLAENDELAGMDWHIDVVVVLLNLANREAKVKFLENVIL